MKTHTITLEVIEYEPGDKRDPVKAKLLHEGSFLYVGEPVGYRVAAAGTEVMAKGVEHTFVFQLGPAIQSFMDKIAPMLAPDPNDEFACLGAMLQQPRRWMATLKKYGVTDRDVQEELNIRSRSWVGHEHIARDLIVQALERAKENKDNRRAVALEDVRVSTLEAMNSHGGKALDTMPEDAILETWLDPYVNLHGVRFVDMPTADLMALAVEIRAAFAEADDLFELEAKEARHAEEAHR